jgi:hypothetical protein
MEIHKEQVECAEHGKQQATFVCQHIIQTLRDGHPRGFWWADDPDNPKPDAWCSECEAKVREAGGAWNEESESFAGVTLLCAACYDKAQEINLGSKKLWWQFWK